MRSTIFLIIILLTMHTTAAQTIKDTLSATIDPDSKEQEFGKRVFVALQTNDEKCWAALYPTNEEYKALLQLMLDLKVEGLTQQKIDSMIKRRKKEATAEYNKRLRNLQEKAAGEGVSWPKAVYQNFQFAEVYPANSSQKYLDGVIRFTIDKMHYIFEGVQAVDIPSGYKLQSATGIRRID